MSSTPSISQPARRRDAEANRQRILAVAAEAFASEGLGVSMVEIARRAGVGNATVHRNYSCKQQLLDELLEEWFERRREGAVLALSDPDPWRGMVEFLEDVLADSAANRSAFVLYGIRLKGNRRLDGALQKLIERAQSAGLMRTDVTVQDLITVLMGVNRTIEITAVVAPEQWRRHLALVLSGLRSDADGPLPGKSIELGLLEIALQEWAQPLVGRDS